MPGCRELLLSEENIFLQWLVSKMLAVDDEETRQKEIEQMQRQIDMTELRSKVDGLNNFSAGTFFFTDRKYVHGKAPAL